MVKDAKGSMAWSAIKKRPLITLPKESVAPRLNELDGLLVGLVLKGHDEEKTVRGYELQRGVWRRKAWLITQPKFYPLGTPTGRNQEVMIYSGEVQDSLDALETHNGWLRRLGTEDKIYKPGDWAFHHKQYINGILARMNMNHWLLTSALD